MTKPTGISLITSLDGLHDINGEPSPSTLAKIIPTLEKHAINFIERSPFLIIGTGSNGSADTSPRGDGPGFVKVLDDTTLLIPERPGNRIADTLRNILDNPAVGLIFMIPGMNETLRINGDAYITNEQEHLDAVAHNGKSPKLAIVVDVKEIYFHCPKAFIRSKLWDSNEFMPRGEMPTLGKIVLEQIRGQEASEAEVAAVDASLEKDAKDNLYHQ